MTDIVVRPVRFTDNVAGMRSFLEAVGLRPRLESDHGGWIDMVADSGMVAIHSARDSTRGAPSGLTSISFEAENIDLVAARLTAAGVADVVVYDEAYGRVLGCSDPLGEETAIDERSTDLYGYRQHDPKAPPPGLRVVAVRFGADHGSYGHFLAALGLSSRDTGDDGESGAVGSRVTGYQPGDDGGLVLLHPAVDGYPPFAGQPGAVRLAFESGEDFEAIQVRLRDTGFDADIVEQRGAQVLRTTDADGLAIEIHPTTAQ